MLPMLVAPALAIALCTFGVGVLMGAIRVLRRGDATPGRAATLAVVAVGSTGAFLLLATTYPALLINTLLRALTPDVALPERPSCAARPAGDGRECCRHAVGGDAGTRA